MYPPSDYVYPLRSILRDQLAILWFCVKVWALTKLL